MTFYRLCATCAAIQTTHIFALTLPPPGPNYMKSLLVGHDPERT